MTFPDDYGAPALAGKAATFDVTVKEVSAAESVEINDDLAAKLGVENVDKMRQAVKQKGGIDSKKTRRFWRDSGMYEQNERDDEK